MKGSDASDGSLIPIELMAFTLNSYCTPSRSPFTLYTVSLIVSLLTGIHERLWMSIRSIWYPVIGDPPSDSGGLQVSSAQSWPSSCMTGASFGALGFSAFTEKMEEKEK